MGFAGRYTCTDCGYTTEWVTADFDCGMMGDVVTPVVCSDHGLQEADTGLSARCDPDWLERRQGAYPCPVCKRPAPVWDRRTCPACGHQGAVDEGWSAVRPACYL